MLLFQLVRAGYGTLGEVEAMDARTVLQALSFEKYLIDYENAFLALNR